MDVKQYEFIDTSELGLYGRLLWPSLRTTALNSTKSGWTRTDAHEARGVSVAATGVVACLRSPQE
jgi:hypothetical protein